MDKVKKFIKDNFESMSDSEMGAKFGLSEEQVRRKRRSLGLKKPQQGVREQAGANLGEDREKFHKAQEMKSVSARYKEALAGLESMEEKMKVVLDIRADTTIHAITPYKADTISEATAICLASDWHIEERVDSAKTNGLNEYSLDISRQRADQFFQRLLKLVNKEEQDVSITHVVLALLGDFITGNIHEELPALCAVPPVKAILIAQEYIVSGIQFLLDHSKYRFTIVCTCGNHARITKKVHWGTEQENSLEYLMYCNLRQRFANEKRITFIVSEAYHCHLKVYGTTIRFHHGHTIKYQGGIGGITVPVNNKIMRWSKSPIKVDLDCFGHLHQLLDGGQFIANGSMIGYGAMGALFGGYERPQQSLFLIDKVRGKTVNLPILFSV